MAFRATADGSYKPLLSSSGHRRSSSHQPDGKRSTGQNGGTRPTTWLSSFLHRSPSRRHRRSSSYDTSNRSFSTSSDACGEFAAGQQRAGRTPRMSSLQHIDNRKNHRRGESSSSFGSDTSFQGIKDQFKQYQKETLQRTRSRKERNDPEHHTDACDDCCTFCFIPCCCVTFWLCCFCCSRREEEAIEGEPRSSNRNPRAMKYNIDPLHRIILQGQGGAPIGNHWLGLVPSIFYSILLLIAFLSMSSTTKFIDESHRTWTLFQGETRQVPVPVIFNKDIQVSTQSNDGGGVHVFSFERDCPPLTGPPVFLQDGPHSLQMDEGDYMYHYFWLNEGSNIKVEVNQLHGASNVYILMGEQLLERLVHENHDYAYDGGFKFSLLKQFVTAPKIEGQTSATLEYTTLETNTYILLYENASKDEKIVSAIKSSEKSVVSVQYNISLTSHAVQSYSPICTINSSAESHGDVDVRVCVVSHASVLQREGCLLVQATNALQTGNTTSYSTIYVSESRRWVPLILCSLIPIWLVFLIRAGYDFYHKNVKSWHCTESTEAAISYAAPTDVGRGFSAEAIGESDGLLNLCSSPSVDYRSIPFAGEDKVAISAPLYPELP